MQLTIKQLMVVFTLSAGCTKASNETSNNTGAAPRATTVTLTSVTLADDCGGIPPNQAPVHTASTAPASPAVRAPGQEPSDLARRRCEQTSMQLAITAPAATDVSIKSVEVFDETGKSLGTLSPSKPTRWSEASATYEAWDEKVVAGQPVHASYVLSQPGFVDRYGSHDRTYTVKVVASAGGADRPLQTTVMIAAQPAPAAT